MLLTWTKQPSWLCSRRCGRATCIRTTRWRELRRLPFADLGFARVDHHRALRQGLPEAVYGPGKTPEHAAAIVGELLDGGASPVLLTRASDEQAAAALAAHPDGQHARHHRRVAAVGAAARSGS